MVKWQQMSRSISRAISSATDGQLIVNLVALLVLASGILNLVSVERPFPPMRVAQIEDLMPAGFVHLSRFVTMLAGIALVVVSVNIRKRKRRAYHTVVAMLLLSCIFHVAKGLDFREALMSFASLAALIPVRKYFTVRSGRPGLGRTLAGVAWVVVVCALYGTLGFWFFDRRQFGVEFSILGSVRRTFEFMLFLDDPAIVPRTRLAHWFIQSLEVLSVAVIIYAVIKLYRPVLYRLREAPRDRQTALEILHEHGRTALDYFSTWPDKSIFLTRAHDAFIAYSVSGNFAVVLGDPIGPGERIANAITEFTNFCAQADWLPVFHQAAPDFWTIYQPMGFRRLKLGDEGIVDLTTFTLEGRAQKELRHAVRRLERDGYHLEYVEPPASDEVVAQMREISDDWLIHRGHRERRFTLGRFEDRYVRDTRLLVALDASGRPVAFVNIVPSYRRGEATIDMMRQRADAPNGVMDFMFVRLFTDFKAQGLTRFSLGLAPMSGFQPDEVAGVEEKIVHYFFSRMNFWFNYQGLRRYKAKFATIWEPRYLVYQNPADLPRIALAIRRVTEIDDREDPVPGETKPETHAMRHPGLEDLPIIQVNATGHPTGTMAILWSGDGGWNVTEKGLSLRLATAGIPVAGLNCLRYFLKRRTPESSTHDLERMLEHYFRLWNARDVLLIGYSRGACVMPFMVTRLRADLRARVRELVLLGPDGTIDFQFHAADLVTNLVRATSLPVLPELEQLRGMKITCIYGSREKGSLCRNLPEGLAEVVERPGGHIIWNGVDSIAGRIIGSVLPAGHTPVS
jgi:phosphatidylglycerol lysyltransferase